MNYSESKIGCPTPVGVYPLGATPDGISDLAGNVWEWCADWFKGDYYAESPANDPKEPTSGSGRVLRGGAWDDYVPGLCRGSYRINYVPVARFDGFGFRVVSSSCCLGLPE
jgi:sulfatase modifying factor 1